MELFVLRTSGGWDRGNGAAVIIADSLPAVEAMMREYEMEECLTCYQTEVEAESDVIGPTRHTWVEVERFPSKEEQPRIVLISWDEAI